MAFVTCMHLLTVSLSCLKVPCGQDPKTHLVVSGMNKKCREQRENLLTPPSKEQGQERDSEALHRPHSIHWLHYWHRGHVPVSNVLLENADDRELQAPRGATAIKTHYVGSREGHIQKQDLICLCVKPRL